MGATIAFNDLQILDAKEGAAGEYFEARYLIAGPGFEHWYCRFSTDHFSGAQWEDEHGTAIDAPHVVVTPPAGIDWSPDEWNDDAAWLDELLDRFWQAHEAAWARVRAAEAVARATFYPFTPNQEA